MHNHSPDCDIYDRPPEGIEKPCNCGFIIWPKMWPPEIKKAHDAIIDGFLDKHVARLRLLDRAARELSDFQECLTEEGKPRRAVVDTLLAEIEALKST